LIVHELESIVRRINPAALFPQRPGSIEVELGSGDGSFLIEYARAHPEKNFLGIERLLGRVQKTARKSARAGLDNVRLIRLEAGYFLEWMLPLESIDTLHVYFPDPWPKRKHRKYRLINERFPALADRVLLDRGCLHLRTDHADYFEQMTQVMREAPCFEPIAPPLDLTRWVTDFEAGFMAQGLPIYRASYRKLKLQNQTAA